MALPVCGATPIIMKMGGEVNHWVWLERVQRT